MKNAVTSFCIVALTLAAQPATAHRHLLTHAWEFQPQQCSARPQDLRRQLVCSDPDLRAADIALSKAYQEKSAQLDPAEVAALRSDSKAWWTYSCVGNGRDGRPPSREVVRMCLKQALTERRQFVFALPTDRPKSAYLFSQTELGLLRTKMRTYSVVGGGLINRTGYDALTIGLRRVFAAVLPHKPAPRYAISDSLTRFTADAFWHATSDDAAALEDGRYMVDYGSDWGQVGVEGMFVVDLETGETILAFVDEEEPVLLIWQKACVSQSLQHESYALFQKYIRQMLKVGWPRGPANGEVDSRIYSTPCN